MHEFRVMCRSMSVTGEGPWWELLVKTILQSRCFSHGQTEKHEPFRGLIALHILQSIYRAVVCVCVCLRVGFTKLSFTMPLPLLLLLFTVSPGIPPVANKGVHMYSQSPHQTDRVTYRTTPSGLPSLLHTYPPQPATSRTAQHNHSISFTIILHCALLALYYKVST
jgi:hypothetical protein